MDRRRAWGANAAQAWRRWPAASAGRRAVTGAVAALSTLSVGTLVAAILPNGASPQSVIGAELISLAPAGVREAAISAVGTADKPVIVMLSIAGPVVLLALLGVAARRTPTPLLVGLLLVVGLVATAAGAAAPAGAGSAALGGLLSGAAGAATILPLSGTRGVAVQGPAEAPSAEAAGYSRRQFIRAAGLVAGAAVLVGAVGTALVHTMQTSVEAQRRAIRLPRVAGPLPPVPPGASFSVPGLTPLVTANADFYRIDTALDVPQVDPHTWQLAVDGMVRHPFSLSYAELLAMPQVESDITLCCVSDVLGGNLISSARWQGVRLSDLLARAGPLPGAAQVVGGSVDGFTAAFPLAAAVDGRDALVAVGMNGVPLPLDHGFPARLVVPGLYGYVSATKWLTHIQLTAAGAVNGFWVDRGWDPGGPIRTESRIDVPADGGQVGPGSVVIAGVAWAQHRGIRAVEVRVDGGRWQAADTATALSIDTWRQWRLVWNAGPGPHTVEVRAIDAAGVAQTPRRADPFPAGATGYHTIAVLVG